MTPLKPAHFNDDMKPPMSIPGALATVSVFLQFYVNATAVKSLGMMLVAMQDEFGSETWVLGTVFAVIECISDLLGEHTVSNI